MAGDGDGWQRLAARWVAVVGGGGAMVTGPRIHEQKNSKVSNGLSRYVKQTEILTDATHVNGWKTGVELLESKLSCLT